MKSVLRYRSAYKRYTNMKSVLRHRSALNERYTNIEKSATMPQRFEQALYKYEVGIAIPQRLQALYKYEVGVATPQRFERALYKY